MESMESMESIENISWLSNDYYNLTIEIKLHKKEFTMDTK
jgi:hypothetical protein